MPKLIKDYAVVEHEWQLIRTEDELANAQINDAKWLVPLSHLSEVKSHYPNAHIGVWVSPDVDVAALEPICQNLPVIAIDFPAFADGRGFSIARTLREYFDYDGEIRAIGNFIPDQLFYLSRCGFNSYEFSDDVNEEALLSFFETFTEKYQAGTDEPQPLFRRRA